MYGQASARGHTPIWRSLCLYDALLFASLSPSLEVTHSGNRAAACCFAKRPQWALQARCERTTAVEFGPRLFIASVQSVKGHGACPAVALKSRHLEHLHVARALSMSLFMEF